MGDKFLALRKSEVAKVVPDRSALMGKLNQDMKEIREADERLLCILFGEPYEAKFQSEGTGSAIHVYDGNGDEILTYTTGVAERKAAQIAEREVTRAAESGNAFNGTGDFKQQYLVLSENLYNNGFYDNLSDDKVRNMEQMLKDITSGMESISGNGLNRNFSTEMSHEAAKLELVSSVNALNYFADKYVPEEMKNSFKEMIKQYESYNSEKVAAHKSIYDLRDERMAAILLFSTLNDAPFFTLNGAVSA